jgi:hypothetical protein
LWRQICGKALQQLNRSAAHHPHVCETDNLQTIWQTQQGIWKIQLPECKDCSFIVASRWVNDQPSLAICLFVKNACNNQIRAR